MRLVCGAISMPSAQLRTLRLLERFLAQVAQVLSTFGRPPAKQLGAKLSKLLLLAAEDLAQPPAITLFRGVVEPRADMIDRGELIDDFAEVVLDLVQARIKLVVRAGRHDCRRQLQGVAQSFARDPQPVQLCILVQVGLGQLKEIAHKRPQLLSAERRKGWRVLAGMTLGPADPGEQVLGVQLEPIALLQAAAQGLERLTSLAALRPQDLGNPLAGIKPFRLQMLKVHITIADRASLAADFAECLFHPLVVRFRDGGLEQLEGSRSPARPNAELVDGFRLVGFANRFIEEVADGEQPLGESSASHFVGWRLGISADEPLLKAGHD
jgi:hypothetical protein